MKWLENLKEFYYETVNAYRQIGLDKKYKKEFVRVIHEASADAESPFVKQNFKIGDDGESVFLVTSVPVEFQTSGQDYLIQDKLNENTYFATQFLKREMGGGEYITIPEFYHVEDPSSEEISLTYLAVWRFNPMVDDKLKPKIYMKVFGIPLAVVAAVAGTVLAFVF